MRDQLALSSDDEAAPRSDPAGSDCECVGDGELQQKWGGKLMLFKNSIWRFHCLAVLAFLSMYFAVAGFSPFALLFGLACILSPVIVNFVISIFTKARTSQIVLLCMTLAYTVWTCLVYFSATAPSNDGQGGFVILATTIVALPFFLIAWASCLLIEWRSAKSSVGAAKQLVKGGITG